MNNNILNEAVIRKDLSKCLNEAVTEEPKDNQCPMGVEEWTFADWFGEDLTGKTYDGDINCLYGRLTSLKGAPEKVSGNFNCSFNQLTSLEGAPKEVKGDYNCSFNYLTSLKGVPEKINGNFDCGYNKITSLEGAPEKISGSFGCRRNQITSLQGAPKIVNGNFDCSGNKLTSLEGAPKITNGTFSCHENQLTSLEGAPEKVGGHFWCQDNQLTSLKGAPKEVDGDFSCGSEQIFTEGFDKNVSIGGHLIISLKSIDNIIDTIPDGCKINAETNAETNSEIENSNDIDLGNGWKLNSIMMDDEASIDINNHDYYHFVFFDGISFGYNDQKIRKSFEEYCEANDVNDEIEIIGINASMATIGVYCIGKKRGGVNWKSATKSAKILASNYGRLEKWMSDNGLELNNKMINVIEVDYNAHNF